MIPRVSARNLYPRPISTQFWGLYLEQNPQGPPRGHLGTSKVKGYFQSLLFKDFVANWGPHWGPKNHTGGLQVATELPKTSFGGDFLRTYFLHENWVQKLAQTVVFFGPVDVAKT